MAHVKMTHVPYRGVSAAELDLMAGTIDVMFDSISTAVPLVKAGKLRALAVTGKSRIQVFPDLPTVHEGGLNGFDVEATYMVIAPAKTPADVVTQLSNAINEVTRMPDVQQAIEALYAKPLAGGPKETTAFLQAEEDKWVQVVKATGVKVE
jgi:tripartite-type tricarboxylate transporter receptor subunit TctC